MLELFKNFLADVVNGGKPQDRFDEGDYRLAAAALLVHVIAIDHEMSSPERASLHAILKRRFNLDDETTNELISEAIRAEGEAVDLYHFTSAINRSIDEDGRRRIVEMMWEIIFADGRIKRSGHVNEFEDNIVWRAADLLGVSSRERIELRRRVAEQAGAGNGS